MLLLYLLRFVPLSGLKDKLDIQIVGGQTPAKRLPTAKECVENSASA